MIPILRVAVALLLTAAAAVALSQRSGSVPPVGALLDPLDGLYRTARLAEHENQEAVTIPVLDGPVQVIRDERGVPHIFAQSDRDAIMAMGYVVAQDRLFQLDFTPRAAAGRLAEVMGPQAVETDRFLRQTGMEMGARRNLKRILQENGIEKEIITWFAAGVNAYVDGLDDEDLPFEFRLLGYRPERYTPMRTLRVLEYMIFDLTYGSDDVGYSALRARLGDEVFERLYPRNAKYHVPIIPESARGAQEKAGLTAPLRGLSRQRLGLSVADQASNTLRPEPAPRPVAGATSLKGGVQSSSTEQSLSAMQQALLGSVAEGAVPGKGSNNWAVDASRSATGAPILAGDPHLNLSLPPIWYEVHLVTPTMNTYGVTIPGAPLPVIGFTDRTAWTFTNTGSDQIDRYVLTLDDAGTHYRYQEMWRPLEMKLDTIYVAGGEPVVDTTYLAHWGPAVIREGVAVATHWTGHDPAHTLKALWGMHHADDYEAFEEALRYWDAPTQNILYAGADGTIAIRSTGRFPIRKTGTGAGLLDGSTDAHEWVGSIPFEDVPHSVNPGQGYLASSNQQPTDSLYPYYLGRDWRNVYRSIRIDSLLSRRERHTVEDFMRYQADVRAVQRDFFAPLVVRLDSLSARAEALRRMLAAWDGETSVDRPEPLIIYVFLETLEQLAWDEPAFLGLLPPHETILYDLLRNDPEASWLDYGGTPEREDAQGLLRLALEQTAATLAEQYGSGPEQWRWGDHHKIVFRHLTRSEALRPLWRGPYEYPGFEATLSPAGDLMTTHSGSWRMIVDFSQVPARGWGMYPGGPSGNPFSPYYDSQIQDYVAFEYYPLHNPASPEALDAARISSHLTLRPGDN